MPSPAIAPAVAAPRSSQGLISAVVASALMPMIVFEPGTTGPTPGIASGSASRKTALTAKCGCDPTKSISPCKWDAIGERCASAAPLSHNAPAIGRVSAPGGGECGSGAAELREQRSRLCVDSCSRQSLQQVIAHADCVGDGGKRGIHRADADEKARVHDVEVVELVRLAIDVEDGGFGIAAEATGAGLMGAAGDGNVGLHVDVARDQVLRMHVEMAQHRLELLV